MITTLPLHNEQGGYFPQPITLLWLSYEFGNIWLVIFCKLSYTYFKKDHLCIIFGMEYISPCSFATPESGHRTQNILVTLTTFATFTTFSTCRKLNFCTLLWTIPLTLTHPFFGWRKHVKWLFFIVLFIQDKSEIVSVISHHQLIFSHWTICIWKYLVSTEKYLQVSCSNVLSWTRSACSSTRSYGRRYLYCLYPVLCSVLYCTVLYPGATDGRPDQCGPRPHEVPARLSAGRKNI